jgi:hypothetical protein
VVHDLCRDFPDMAITINGGVNTFTQVSTTTHLLPYIIAQGPGQTHAPLFNLTFSLCALYTGLGSFGPSVGVLLSRVLPLQPPPMERGQPPHSAVGGLRALSAGGDDRTDGL